jgi:hypothetical protein
VRFKEIAHCRVHPESSKYGYFLRDSDQKSNRQGISRLKRAEQARMTYL